MNVSRNRNLALLFRPLVACLPIGLACCVAPSPDSSSVSFRSTEAALVAASMEPVAAGTRPTILIEEITDITITRVKGGYSIEANAQTDDTHTVELTANPDENQAVTLPHHSTTPTPMWWWEDASGGNGTVTISDANNPKKIMSVMGRNTSNGAHLVFTQFDVSGNIKMTVKNGGPSGTTVINDVSWPTDPMPAGTPDSYSLQPQSDGTWNLEVVKSLKKLSIPITYAP